MQDPEQVYLVPTLADVLGLRSHKQTNTLHPSAVKYPPLLHAIILKHLLYVLVLESFRVKYSHTLDRLASCILTMLTVTTR